MAELACTVAVLVSRPSKSFLIVFVLNYINPILIGLYSYRICFILEINSVVLLFYCHYIFGAILYLYVNFCWVNFNDISVKNLCNSQNKRLHYNMN